MSKLPSYSNDLGLLIDGVGEPLTLTSVDGLTVDFYGFYLPYMNDGTSVTKVGRGESVHDRILVAHDENCPVFSTGDTITRENGERFVIQNEPRSHCGAVWLEVRQAKLMHGGRRGMYEQ